MLERASKERAEKRKAQGNHKPFKMRLEDVKFGAPRDATSIETTLSPLMIREKGVGNVVWYGGFNLYGELVLGNLDLVYAQRSRLANVGYSSMSRENFYDRITWPYFLGEIHMKTVAMPEDRPDIMLDTISQYYCDEDGSLKLIRRKTRERPRAASQCSCRRGEKNKKNAVEGFLEEVD